MQPSPKDDEKMKYLPIPSFLRKRLQEWQNMKFHFFSSYITLFSLLSTLPSAGRGVMSVIFDFTFDSSSSKLSIINCRLSIKSLQTPGDFITLRVAALQFFLMRFKNQSGLSLFQFFHSRNRRIFLQRHLSVHHEESFR